MDQKIESIKEKYMIHKKNLAELAAAKAQAGLEIPARLKRENEREEEAMKQIEAEMRRMNDSLAQELSEIRIEIINLLDEYNKLSARMSEFESMFLTHVLLTGHQLQLAIQKRKFLEREYNRIRENIEWSVYANAEELENDIQQSLKHAEVAYVYKEDEQADEDLKAMSPTAGLELIESDAYLDEERKKEIIKEFKRVVIPKVHSDTSETPFEVFNTVYNAYKKRDYLLMEAFITQYRGELSQKEEEDLLTFLNLMTTYSPEYPSVLERLEKRLKRLKREMTIKELENPEEIRKQIQRQNREIRKAIYEEAEQVLHLRNCLEELKDQKFQKRENKEK